MNKTFLITIGAVVIIFGGVFAYQYFGAQKDSVQNINQIVQSISEGCKIQPYNKSSLESGTIEADVRGGAICKFTINKNLPEYTFHLVGNLELNTIDSIEIYKGSEDMINQTLKTSAGETSPKNTKFFDAEDINFDGYKDIKLMSWWGVTGNTGYDYWLFNSKDNTFVYSKELSELSSLIPHPETKTITSHSNSSAVAYHDETYKFDENGKLILIHSFNQDSSDFESCTQTTSDLVNGKMVTNTKTINCQ